MNGHLRSVRVFAAAAVTGLVAGAASTAVVGCQNKPSDQAGMQSTTESSTDNTMMAKHDCKGQNACKGQGGCKTAQNECKGQNSCKGQGGCKTNK